MSIVGPPYLYVAMNSTNLGLKIFENKKYYVVTDMYR